ncbi:hypothetical protein [Sorlinia euscelidii]|uniref:hypothetical protein n=1 Tax=Sorlinia euscelidii TaxID=3081148 RepID=UPI00374E1844
MSETMTDNSLKSFASLKLEEWITRIQQPKIRQLFLCQSGTFHARGKIAVMELPFPFFVILYCDA